MEEPVVTRTRQNVTKIPRPLTRAPQHPKKQDHDARPKLATVDGNCQTRTRQEDSKKHDHLKASKAVAVSTELTRMRTKLTKEGRTIEVTQKNTKPPSLAGVSSNGVSSNGGTTTSMGTNKKPVVGMRRLKPPKIVKDSGAPRNTTKKELASLEPDCQPDLNSISRVYIYMADSPDLQDSDDPQLCTPYIHNIYQHLLHAEKQNLFRLHKDLLCRQVEVNSNHRRVLVNWMVQVHSQFKLVSDTLHISVDILDRYLQKMPVAKKKLQLVGITALFIASKYEEVYNPSISEFSYISAGLYTTAQICKMEIDVLRTLGYQLGKPNTLTFLRRYSKLMTSTTTHIHNLAKYFIEACYLSTDCRGLLPSQLAVGALLLAASITLQCDTEELWGPIMQRYTWYSKQRASTFANEVVRQMRRYFQLLHSKSSNCMAVKEKYSASYCNVAALPWLQDTMDDIIFNSNPDQKVTKISADS